MNSAASVAPAGTWLADHGPKQLELLFRAIACQVSEPVLIADDHGHPIAASAGASKLPVPLLEKIVVCAVSDLAERDEQEGELPVALTDGTITEVGFIAKKDVLPNHHVVTLGDPESIPAWAKDYALYLLDAEGCVASWYAGAARIYGYDAGEAMGRFAAFFYPDESGAESDALDTGLREKFRRAETEGHRVTEGWQVRKDGSRFWASAVTMAIKDDTGKLRGFAGVVRDFTDRHERDEALRRARERAQPVSTAPTIAGVVSGQLDGVPEMNDTFLDMLGYSREDLRTNSLIWVNMTPSKYLPFDEIAHEEALRFGACTPYEKQFLAKDGSPVPVLVTTAILRLSPLRWISFITDLRERDRAEQADRDVVESGAGKAIPEFEEFVGSSAPMKRVMRQVVMVAPTDATVLILGETGTGKELVARAIHRLSPRRTLPFVSLNCAAIPTGLLESELFGYERGAFTGALAQKIGRFEMAHRGTLFLDEVGDIPLDLQPKLLRALQEKSFERLGGTRTIPIDVRLVAATNRNLNQMMGAKLFRSDLYYRLKVFPIVTPPLRDRPEDIPVLARHFTKKYSEKMDRKIETIAPETMKSLVAWQWPGNIRELENFIERSVILSQGTSLKAPLAELRAEGAESAGDSLLEDVEREHILRILRETGGVISLAAGRLGMPRTTLNAMMKKLGMSRADL